MGETATILLVTKKVAFGSSLFGTMILFQDPAYIMIAGIGAFVSMGSGYYDIRKLKNIKEAKGEECVKDTLLELAKAFFVGFVLSLLSFMLFLQAGGELLGELSGHNWVNKLLPSFWLVFTVALATEAPTLWDKAKNKITGKKGDV